MHNFDPEGVQSSTTITEDVQPMETEQVQDNSTAFVTPAKTQHEQELDRAKSKGLLVDFSGGSSTTSVSDQNTSLTQPNNESFVTPSSNPSSEMAELDRWDEARGDAFSCSDDDSDDDLL